MTLGESMAEFQATYASAQQAGLHLQSLRDAAWSAQAAVTAQEKVLAAALHKVGHSQHRHSAMADAQRKREEAAAAAAAAEQAAIEKETAKLLAEQAAAAAASQRAAAEKAVRASRATSKPLAAEEG